jgi:hypothetical protein
MCPSFLSVAENDGWGANITDQKRISNVPLGAIGPLSLAVSEDASVGYFQSQGLSLSVNYSMPEPIWTVMPPA